MGGMPGFVAKGVFFSRVDKLSRDPARRDAFLEDLRDEKQGYVDILIKHKVARTSLEIGHLRRDWFNEKWREPDSGCWWLAQQPIEPIARRALILAFELAKKRHLPIDSYWICAGNTFEESISWNQQQITRLILTPPMPHDFMGKPPRGLADTDEEGIWIVRRGGFGDETIDPEAIVPFLMETGSRRP